ncbi:MAG: hypothetical protein KPEEDBHJ_03691 [Anaerolineales bacterium]|nr:hypothetical protein [Anaerolineales bacterium]
MLVTTNSVKWYLIILLIFVTTLFAGCVQTTPAPIATAEIDPIFTRPIPTATELLPTHTPTPLPPLPTCTSLPVTYIFIIDESVYNDVDAGIELGAKGAIRALQQAMDDYHPEWGQEVDLAGYLWDHSAAQMIGVNPRVLLVTAGVALDWQAFKNHDLGDISQVGVTLTQHYREFRFNEALQALYPQIANAASYALYAFFNYDLKKLNVWQLEYDRMFGDIQPRINTEGC